MSPSSRPEEGIFTKVASLAAIVGLVIAYLAWRNPVAPSSEAPAQVPEIHATSDTVSPAPPVQPPGPADTSNFEETPPVGGTGHGGGGGAVGAETHPHSPVEPGEPPTPKRVCGAPETLSLQPGAPAEAASRLALLSVKTEREGSEPYLTLGILSDQGTQALMVAGAPARFTFKTRLGAYFVNVSEADLSTGRMTVQVGCEGKSEEKR